MLTGETGAPGDDGPAGNVGVPGEGGDEGNKGEPGDQGPDVRSQRLLTIIFCYVDSFIKSFMDKIITDLMIG